MSTPEKMDGATRQMLRKLDLQVSRRLDGLLHGHHRGLRPGHGNELGETRHYQPGDDIRRIDWNVTARLTDPHIRQTIAERELQTWLVVDRSARMRFGTGTTNKGNLSLAAAAALGSITAADGNRLAAIISAGNDLKVTPPGGGRKHQLRVLYDIAARQAPDASGVTDLADALVRCRALTRTTGFIAVLSDFRVKPGWQKPLAVLARRHDVLAIQVSDPREYELPDVGRIVLQDPATQRQRRVNTSDRALRESFATQAQKHQQQLRDELASMNVDHLHLSTDRPWLDDMARYVLQRKIRLLSGPRNRS